MIGMLLLAAAVLGLGLIGYATRRRDRDGDFPGVLEAFRTKHPATLKLPEVKALA